MSRIENLKRLQDEFDAERESAISEAQQSIERAGLRITHVADKAGLSRQEIYYIHQHRRPKPSTLEKYLNAINALVAERREQMAEI